MSGERHRLWYDSDDRDGEFWMASGAGKFLTTKIDGQIRTSHEWLRVIEGDSTYLSDAAKERKLIARLKKMKADYLTEMAQHRIDRSAPGPARIDRKTFIARINKSVLQLATKLKAEGTRSHLEDLEFVDFYIYFGEIKKTINDLRKHMPPTGNVVGDGHSNSAASAEHFGWSHPKGQHWERRRKSQLSLSENLEKIRGLEQTYGGGFTRTLLFSNGQLELDDCNLSLTDPRQYLIYNRFRLKVNLWQEFFPNDTLDQFMARKDRNWIKRQVNDPLSPTGKSYKRYRP